MRAQSASSRMLAARPPTAAWLALLALLPTSRAQGRWPAEESAGGNCAGWCAGCAPDCCPESVNDCGGCGVCTAPSPPTPLAPQTEAERRADATAVHFAPAAKGYLDDVYYPAWKELFLHEGDGYYPMPAASETVDLLAALKGVDGIAVRTQPGTTVTEGQAYAMLVAGMRKDVDDLKGLVVAWQANGQAFGGQPACGGCCGAQQNDIPRQVCAAGNGAPGVSPNLCRQVPGAYMPGWQMPMATLGSMGSATDADEDAIIGIIYLAELLNDDEVRTYAVKSIIAFVLQDLGMADPISNSRPTPKVGDIPKSLLTMYLWRGGSCWGGFDNSMEGNGAAQNRNLCIAPAYFSPGQWRLMAKYLRAHSHLIPDGFASAHEYAEVLNSAIVWGYNTLARISCPNGLVSNWWKLSEGKDKWPWEAADGLACTNSGTGSGEYGSDAARIPWRVALDYIWFTEETLASPHFDEDGRHIGTFGAKEYSNRWASAWRDAVVKDKGGPNGKYYDILPMLKAFDSCQKCPKGVTASPWNGWGAFPVAAAFQVPLDGYSKDTMQQWTEFIAKVAFDGTTHAQYFDLGSQIVVSAMLSGLAWLPEGLDRMSAPTTQAPTTEAPPPSPPIFHPPPPPFPSPSPPKPYPPPPPSEAAIEAARQAKLKEEERLRAAKEAAAAKARAEEEAKLEAAEEAKEEAEIEEEVLEIEQEEEEKEEEAEALLNRHSLFHILRVSLYPDRYLIGFLLAIALALCFCFCGGRGRKARRGPKGRGSSRGAPSKGRGPRGGLGARGGRAAEDFEDEEEMQYGPKGGARKAPGASAKPKPGKARAAKGKRRSARASEEGLLGGDDDDDEGGLNLDEYLKGGPGSFPSDPLHVVCRCPASVVSEPTTVNV